MEDKRPQAKACTRFARTAAMSVGDIIVTGIFVVTSIAAGLADSVIKFKATKVGKDTVLAQIVSLPCHEKGLILSCSCILH
jgi:hypothetical protein